MIPTKENGSLGKNIKVHFAGADYDKEALMVLNLGDVKYRLYSVYSSIATKKVGSDLKEKDSFTKKAEGYFNHTIQDSGLYTLMFGAGRGREISFRFLKDWQDKLISFVSQNELTCTCVEIDCQKVLGVKEAWLLRERMKKKMKNRIINVFHFEDGREGLNSLVDFSDYIAISVPELRIIKPKTFEKDIYRIASYIKNRKPEIDIHLLGCTDKRILAQNKFCTSADSSSWIYAYKRHTIQGFDPRLIKETVQEELKKEIIERIGEEEWDNFSESKKRMCIRGLLSARLNKRVYERYAGDQN